MRSVLEVILRRDAVATEGCSAMPHGVQSHLGSSRKPDESPTVSIRRADGCEGSHDCVGARSKLDDRERFVKKRKCDGVATLQRATHKAKRVEYWRTGVWN